MRLEHIAIWTEDLERLKIFYVKYFGMKANEKYINSKKGFSSYFLSMDGESTRFEIMQSNQLDLPTEMQERIGLTHFAFDVGSKEKVDQMTASFQKEGIVIVGEPRLTGDGYYESVLLDPDGNRIELMA
ncbi:VOC family protein [Flammeovirga sp. EKP202]|uniref:VOC family protein n=1 Tax=Flammeovirga sp. EKP202 TaxID=2770592 RepID=UPI00165F2A2B|nr:VOC family protein [Flammeovirga sp. EKP202]MBD0400718.1 VOC family protein [Flammeovirga sp. EKP202]